MIHGIHESTGNSARLICQTLHVSHSSYYHSAEPTPRQISDAKLTELIIALFWEYKRCCGYRCICDELADASRHSCHLSLDQSLIYNIYPHVLLAFRKVNP